MASGEPVRVPESHDLWLLIDQDCDLAWRAVDGASPPFLAELRPVFVENPPDDWGIRSQAFRIDDDGRHLQAWATAVRATPEVVAMAEHLGCLEPDAQQRLKTWLGYRYDRPAVPQRFVGLARALADQLSKKRQRDRALAVRDVLAQFWIESDGSTAYALVAVLPGGPFAGNEEAVVIARQWLAEAALAVDADLGSAVDIHAYGDQEVALAYVEGSFSLDLSRLSWPPNTPGPVGAT